MYTAQFYCEKKPINGFARGLSGDFLVKTNALGTCISRVFCMSIKLPAFLVAVRASKFDYICNVGTSTNALKKKCILDMA